METLTKITASEFINLIKDADMDIDCQLLYGNEVYRTGKIIGASETNVYIEVCVYYDDRHISFYVTAMEMCVDDEEVEMDQDERSKLEQYLQDNLRMDYQIIY